MNFRILVYINFKIIMGTDVYNYLPGIGLAGLITGGVMISSNAKNNIKNLNKLKINKSDWVCIYPEGYLSHKKNKIKSDLYCQQNNLQPYKYSLYPKTTGVEILAKNNKINSIFSICTYYENLTPIHERYRLFDTSIPKNVYLNLNIDAVSDIDNRFNNNLDIDNLNSNSNLNSDNLDLNSDNLDLNTNLNSNNFNNTNLNNNKSIKSNIINIFQQMDEIIEKLNDKNDKKNYEKLNTDSDSLYCFIFQILIMILNLYLLYNFSNIQILFIGEIIIYYSYIWYLVIF